MAEYNTPEGWSGIYRQMLDSIRSRARSFQAEVWALSLAYRHPGTPWYARAWVAIVVGYAFSPVDLIPDFIPLLGYLDDLILIPLGVWLALRLIPHEVMVECREQARMRMSTDRPKNWIAAAVIILIWLGLATTLGIAIYHLMER